MSLIIALPRERRSGERRVALDPSRVERLQQSGQQVRIEAQCGHLASFYDESYQDVTVMGSFADVVREADIVVKVVCPTLDEIALLQPHTVLVCIMSAFQHLEEVEALRERQITVLGMDHLPRTTRAQPMDALSSQATVAGYKAALLAAELSPRLFPMLTTAAGTIRPSRVLVIGAGVAGLQAIATSRRLGAQVEAYDIRKAAKEQIESLGARMIDTGVEVEGAGGVARALRKDEKQLQHDVLAEHLARAHVVICAAALPGRRAPRIITKDMVNGMLPESVIVDMAASSGGNCELTRIGEHYYYNDTLIAGPLNLPSHGAVHASEMYARNVHNMLQLIIVDNEVVLNPEDEIIARCVLMHAGSINHPNIASLLKTEAVPFGHAAPAPAELPDQNSGWLREEADTNDSPVADAEQATGGSDESVTDRTAGAEQDMGDDATSPGAAQSIDQVDTLATLELSDSAIDEQDLRDLAALEGVDADEIVRLAATSKPAGVTVAVEEAELPCDELILIDGVGPALQQRLYAFGYRLWQDLAELDDDALEKLTVRLELSDEVREQDWRGQAQRLMEKKP
ncbi:hypothetical protein [Granulosicoccus antarcticus]|uniref:proton-translocating NAD(P)(+) transhydrogenase n=1 Tax=Granulosicoccus antarcticus IMCC3135 TaxID=1192854 RepID=A0A2Z2NH01_9GAMM|nr:hypothetical protein [Granulosicoccus antarcticus]ASJ70409.1 NAD(P) transhydrogenase subunit alpha part 1 [Granulosicoccus antarcticus IMCC3135]